MFLMASDHCGRHDIEHLYDTLQRPDSWILCRIVLFLPTSYLITDHWWTDSTCQKSPWFLIPCIGFYRLHNFSSADITDYTWPNNWDYSNLLIETTSQSSRYKIRGIKWPRLIWNSPKKTLVGDIFELSFLAGCKQ